MSKWIFVLSPFTSPGRSISLVFRAGSVLQNSSGNTLIRDVKLMQVVWEKFAILYEYHYARLS